MDHLSVKLGEVNSVKARAIEDARQRQISIIESAKRAGKDPPKYVLMELIGKGSFGRVYKGKNLSTAKVVAVKILDIDESDTANPRTADSYSEFLKEVNALKILSENKARNINHVIEALPVDQTMWIVTEYCAGGSVATLMKPTAPGGLQEKWIVPIVREVAEAIKWVHKAGIIHRDIKCANVLITEKGDVQLCDFGVAGTLETKLDKRSTFIGTLHWMAPELFDSSLSYGKEVDIWAFGAMVYEIATGLPPNVSSGVPYENLGTYLKTHAPRLEGGDYSQELRSLVAYCLQELPSARPTIEQVQKHPYIYNSSATHPTSSLSHLVRAFKVWEDRGSKRESLFAPGGAQSPSETPIADEWNFSTTAAFDQMVSTESASQEVYEAYGTQVELDSSFDQEETVKLPQHQKPSRRRPPPEALAPLKAPLEKVFDPNTLSSYNDNSRNQYHRSVQKSSSDLPLRDNSAQTSIKGTTIDLGGHDPDTGLSSFPEFDTIKAEHLAGADEANHRAAGSSRRPARSDPATANNNRRTQEWKFPVMSPTACEDSESLRHESPQSPRTPGSSDRPPLVHYPTEPAGFGGGLMTPQRNTNRTSMQSLIDLDMSIPEPLPELTRPSTANSEVGSAASGQMTPGIPFDLENHPSLYRSDKGKEREPSIYVTDDYPVATPFRTEQANPDFARAPDYFVSSGGSGSRSTFERLRATFDRDEVKRHDGPGLAQSGHLPKPSPPPTSQNASAPRPERAYTMERFPDLPPPPSSAALSGTLSNDEMVHEMTRMLDGLSGQLEAFRDVYNSPAIAQGRNRSRHFSSDAPGNNPKS